GSESAPLQGSGAGRCMNLYIDDDSVDALLVKLLQKAGHDIQVPADVGNRGASDAVHLRHAVREDRTCLTRNHDDFKDLHDLVLQAQGHHPGILVVRSDNNPKKDLDNAGIVKAIAKLLAAGLSTADEFVILNHWR